MIVELLSDRRFFPTCLIVLDVCAAMRYSVIDGEWRRAIYWFAAAVLTFTVTW
jgi:uncharacterized membrane protein